MSRAPQAATFVGRYQIVERLASGGMGVVFRAHDPQLSRYVALKLLLPSSLSAAHTGGVEEHEQRLLREARALASLSHPNVVAAFDVGKVDGELFIAMALIDGVTLRTWLMEAPRSRAQVLRVLLDAGRGLAAAHRAGVVHRDFKLSNVMISTSGHVQVVDFGLARTTATLLEAPAGGAAGMGAELAGSGASSGELTRTGTIVGTPGYIAPEQFEGQPSDARSDQFSYASAVFRALTGDSPYPSDSFASYRSALLQGERVAWPRSIPRAIRRVIDRGLSRSPDARYPSLDALLDDLERAARPRRRLLALMAASLAVSVVAAGAAARARFVDRCDVDAQSFDRAWGPSQQAAVQAAFSASGNPRAASTFHLVAGLLGDYRNRWQHAKQEACLATHGEREQSQKILDLRYACLDRKLVQLGTLVRLLEQPDAALVDRAPEALDAIAQLRDCSDVAVLVGESDRVPDDPARRAQLEALQARSDSLEAILSAGRWSDVLEQGNALAGDAERAGYRSTQALAMARTLQALERLGRRGDADVLRSRTLEVAAEARAYEVVAQLAVRLLLLAVDGGRVSDAKALLPLVDASVAAAGRPPALQIRLLTYEANILTEDLAYDAALAKLQLALAECQRLGSGGARSCLTPRRELGALHAARNDYSAARVEFEAAVEIAKKAYGPGHPTLLNEYNNFGAIAASWGDVDTAARMLAESKALAASLPENRQTANIPLVEGVLLLRRGDLPRALERLEEAVRTRSRAYGERTVQVAWSRNALSVCLASLGRMPEALAELQLAREIRLSADRAELEIDFAYRLPDTLWADPERRSQSLERARVVHELLLRDGSRSAKDAQKVKDWLDAHGGLGQR
jgi:tetratricopeptide (TPR) repeat protein